MRLFFSAAKLVTAICKIFRINWNWNRPFCTKIMVSIEIVSPPTKYLDQIPVLFSAASSLPQQQQRQRRKDKICAERCVYKHWAHASKMTRISWQTEKEKKNTFSSLSHLLLWPPIGCFTTQSTCVITTTTKTATAQRDAISVHIFIVFYWSQSYIIRSDARMWYGNMGGCVAVWLCDDAKNLSTNEMLNICFVSGPQYRRCEIYFLLFSIGFWFVCLLSVRQKKNKFISVSPLTKW